MNNLEILKNSKILYENMLDILKNKNISEVVIVVEGEVDYEI